jgi:hypothetical protein
MSKSRTQGPALPPTRATLIDSPVAADVPTKHPTDLAPVHDRAHGPAAMPGLRGTTIAALLATAACVAAAAPGLISALPGLWGDGAAQELSKVDLMSTLAASTSAGVFAAITFLVAPELRQLQQKVVELAGVAGRQRAEAAEEARRHEARIEQLSDLVETLTRQASELRRAKAEHSARRATPSRNSVRINRREAFGGAGPGVATTMEPRWVQEAHLETDPHGNWQLYASDDAVPEAFSRLDKDSPTTLWRVILPITHDRECLEVLVKLVWGLSHYSREARYCGRTLDLTKLEVRLMDSPLSGYTTVLLPQVANRAGDIRMTVLQYQFADVVTGDGRIAVAVSGPLHERAMQRHDLAITRSHTVPTHALTALLRDCVPTQDGRVSAEAIRAWLDTPLVTIGDLRNWRIKWPENPDSA